MEILQKERYCGSMWKGQTTARSTDITHDLSSAEPEEVPALESKVR